MKFTDDDILRAIAAWFNDRGFQEDFKRRMRNAINAALQSMETPRSQLAARDAALDAVLDWAMKSDGADYLITLLAKHGVHPR